MIIIITDVVYFIQISNTGKDDSITPPDSPSTPMRVEMNLNNIDETQRPETGVRLYPAIPSAPAPDPPFNPYFQIPQPQPEHEHGPAGDTQFDGCRKCANKTCVTCIKMIEGQHFRSSVTGTYKIVVFNLSRGTKYFVFLISRT